jgi:hypothetical protein
MVAFPLSSVSSILPFLLLFFLLPGVTTPILPFFFFFSTEASLTFLLVVLAVDDLGSRPSDSSSRISTLLPLVRFAIFGVVAGLGLEDLLEADVAAKDLLIAEDPKAEDEAEEGVGAEVDVDGLLGEA